MKRRTCGQTLALDRRLEFSKQIRGDQSVFAAIAAVEQQGTVTLAPDDWNLSKGITIDKTVGVLGSSGLMTALPCALASNTDAFIHIKADSVTLRGLRLSSNDGVGIGVYVQANSVTVSDCIISGFYTGLYIDTSNFVSVDSNLFVDCTEYGISVVRSNGCKITGNTVTNNPSGKALLMDANTVNSVVTANVAPSGGIQYTATGKNNVPPNATTAAYTNVANAFTVS